MPFPAFFLLAGALGAREGIINRRDKRQLLDREAERQDAINRIDLGIDVMGVSNQFDARQVEAMNRQFTTAQGMLRSKDPKLQAIGANMLQDIDSAVRGNIQQNENEARADFIRLQDQEVAAAGLGKDDNEKRLERELTMNKQLNDELKPFGESQLLFSKVNKLLDNDDQLASLAGLTAFVQSIDNSVVRQAELLKYQGANGLITQLVNIVNKNEGRDFDPATKQSIRNASAAIINAEKGRATAITNSFQDRAQSFGLSAERVLSGVDENLFTPILIEQTAQEAIEEQADRAEAAQQTFVEFSEAGDQGVLSSVGKFTFGGLGEGSAILADKALQAWQDAGRALRGATLHIDPATGEIWEQDAQGKWTRIEGTVDQKRQAEILRLRSNTLQLAPDDQLRLEQLEAEESRPQRQR